MYKHITYGGVVVAAAGEAGPAVDLLEPAQATSRAGASP